MQKGIFVDGWWKVKGNIDKYKYKYKYQKIINRCRKEYFWTGCRRLETISANRQLVAPCKTCEVDHHDLHQKKKICFCLLSSSSLHHNERRRWKEVVIIIITVIMINRLSSIFIVTSIIIISSNKTSTTSQLEGRRIPAICQLAPSSRQAVIEALLPLMSQLQLQLTNEIWIQGNYSLRRPHKLIIPQAVIRQWENMGLHPDLGPLCVGPL